MICRARGAVGVGFFRHQGGSLSKFLQLSLWRLKKPTPTSKKLEGDPLLIREKKRGTGEKGYDLPGKGRSGSGLL